MIAEEEESEDEEDSSDESDDSGEEDGDSDDDDDSDDGSEERLVRRIYSNYFKLYTCLFYNSYKTSDFAYSNLSSWQVVFSLYITNVFCW